MIRSRSISCTIGRQISICALRGHGYLSTALSSFRSRVPAIGSRTTKSWTERAPAFLHEHTPAPALRILLFSSAYNGMTQHIQRVLTTHGHQTQFQSADSRNAMLSAYAAVLPDLIVCPTLMRRIPSEIHHRTLCFIVHPGVVGDRGPSSLDWAILNGVPEWGVTVLQADEEMDAGPVWAAGRFVMPAPALNRTKAQVYNDPSVVRLASSLVLQAVERAAANRAALSIPSSSPAHQQAGVFKAQVVPLREAHPTIRQHHAERVVDWVHDTTDTILLKMRAADSTPGLKATLTVDGHTLTRFLYNGSLVPAATCDLPPACEPGVVYGKDTDMAGGGIYVATKDGAVRVGQLRAAKSSGVRSETFKTPATLHLGSKSHRIPVVQSGDEPNLSFKIVDVDKGARFGVLRYEFYNGALTTQNCIRLRQAYESAARSPDLKALLIVGAANGINLNVIEYGLNPAREAYLNLLEINALVKAIIRSTHLITVSVLESSAGAGGVWLAAAADCVFGVPGIVLNPHYKRMGLYGSELHTYTGTKRLGSLGKLLALKERAPPLTVADACRLGLLDNLLLSDRPMRMPAATDLLTTVQHFVAALVQDPARLAAFLTRKHETRASDEAMQSLDTYEELELIEMQQDIFGNRNGFHEKRQAFVYKLKATDVADDAANRQEMAAGVRTGSGSESFHDIWQYLQDTGGLLSGADTESVSVQSLPIPHKHSILNYNNSKLISSF